MLIINLTPREEGVYNAQGSNTVPDGWAMIPPTMTLPTTFPRLGEPPKVEEIAYPYEVEEEQVDEETGKKVMVKVQKERVILTVTKMTEGTLPEPVEPEPTEQEQMRADIEYLAIMTGVEL